MWKFLYIGVWFGFYFAWNKLGYPFFPTFIICAIACGIIFYFAPKTDEWNNS